MICTRKLNFLSLSSAPSTLALNGRDWNHKAINECCSCIALLRTIASDLCALFLRCTVWPLTSARTRLPLLLWQQRALFPTCAWFTAPTRGYPVGSERKPSNGPTRGPTFFFSFLFLRRLCILILYCTEEPQTPSISIQAQLEWHFGTFTRSQLSSFHFLKFEAACQWGKKDGFSVRILKAIGFKRPERLRSPLKCTFHSYVILFYPHFHGDGTARSSISALY